MTTRAVSRHEWTSHRIDAPTLVRYRQFVNARNTSASARFIRSDVDHAKYGRGVLRWRRRADSGSFLLMAVIPFYDLFMPRQAPTQEAIRPPSDPATVILALVAQSRRQG